MALIHSSGFNPGTFLILISFMACMTLLGLVLDKDAKTADGAG